jgi:hypothetical protein
MAARITDQLTLHGIDELIRKMTDAKALLHPEPRD